MCQIRDGGKKQKFTFEGLSGSSLLKLTLILETMSQPWNRKTRNHEAATYTCKQLSSHCSGERENQYSAPKIIVWPMTYTGRSSRYKHHPEPGGSYYLGSFLLDYSFFSWQRIKGQLWVFLESQNLNWGHREESLRGRRWIVKRSVQENYGVGLSLQWVSSAFAHRSHWLAVSLVLILFEDGILDSDPLWSDLLCPWGFPPELESCWEESCKLKFLLGFALQGGRTLSLCKQS